jgi:plasmid stabilization system protein ParE
MKALALHPEAEAEFETAADFYESRRRGYGERFRAEVAEAFARIRSTPTAFSLHEGGPARRRLLSRFPYGIYYVERDTDVFVLAVMHQHRNPDYWLDRISDA